MFKVQKQFKQPCILLLFGAEEEQGALNAGNIMITWYFFYKLKSYY